VEGGSIITARLPGDAQRASGDEVGLRLPVDHCHLFDKASQSIMRPVSALG
jgi:hypothetical protein